MLCRGREEEKGEGGSGGFAAGSSAALQKTGVGKHKRKYGLHAEHAPYNTVKSKALWTQLLDTGGVNAVLMNSAVPPGLSWLSLSPQL